MSRFDALIDACRKRARPIVMTTIAMGAGMLPIALPASAPIRASARRWSRSIDADPNNELVVACLEGAILGVLQLTFIPYLAYRVAGARSSKRCAWIRPRRSQGLGKALFERAIGRARERGCYMVQLTTDKTRADAKRFYESLGFVASHEGMKLHLNRVDHRDMAA